jgi:hypothetical protein
MKSILTSDRTGERGVVAVLVSLFIVVLVASVGFAVDIGRAHDEKQKIQIAADAASLAAVGTLGARASLATVTSQVEAIANSNDVASDEVFAFPPRCGTWTNGSFVPDAQNRCDSQTTAVEVTVRRSVPIQFARMISSDDIHIEARSVSFIPPAEIGNCIRPFGVEGSLLDSLRPSVGDTFDIGGTQRQGNWGKIDIDGNSSAGPVFTDLMMRNVCDDSIARGNFVSAGTGNADIGAVFDTLLGDEDERADVCRERGVSGSDGEEDSDDDADSQAKGMVLAVTSDFGQGNCSVQIKRFIKVDLLSHCGRGRNWKATFRVVDLDAEPEAPVTVTRQMVQ